MQIQRLPANEHNNIEQANSLKLHIQITPIQNYYCLNFNADMQLQFSKLFVKQSFILFILQIRTGMSQQGLITLKRCILDFCQQALQKNLNGFGFIINGQYYTIKKPNYQAIRDILNTYVVVSKQDNYLLTLRKLRHVLQTQIYKYQKQIQAIDMIFFTSFVQIDHSLGVKKRSYIDYLNEHEQDCYKQVEKIKKTLDKSMNKYSAHVIGIQKKGQQEEDYSLADRDLYNYIHIRLGDISGMIFFVFIQQQQIQRVFVLAGQGFKPSYTKLIQGFRNLTSLVLSTSVYFQVKIPQVCQLQKQKQKYFISSLYSDDMKTFKQISPYFIQKSKLDLQKLYEHKILIISSQIQNKAIQAKLIKQDQKVQKLYSITSQYCQFKSIFEQIYYKTCFFNWELNNVCTQLKQRIISFKRIYYGNNKYVLQMKVDEEKQQSQRDKLYYIQNQAKQIYSIIFDIKKFPCQTQKDSERKRKAFQQYSALKRKLDVSHQVMMNISKKQIKNDEIGKISQAINFWNIRNSLKNKLIRRINLNPKMIDQTYTKIHQIATNTDYSCIQTSNKQVKHAIGNCIKKNINFGTALRNQDCLAILIEVERPDAAIADPGKIKIRQISPFAISVSNFFNVYHYGIDQLGQLNVQTGGQWIRQYAKLQKQNYQQMWDYWALTQKKYTVPALVPVYLCKQHWEVAKLLMKPCLGWTATGQPLGYTFSQTQNIPFMVLSFAIRRVQQLTYQIQQLQHKFQKNEYKVTQYTLLQRDLLNKKLLRKRMSDLCWILEQTCFQIMKDMSSQHFEQKLSQITIQKYKNYIQNPLQRTIDVISNNSAFLSHLYCVIKLQMLKRPNQEQFHQFFKRLVEEQLRRQTDGWNQEQTQDQFINKLLNSQIQKMDAPQYIVLDSSYYDNFQMLKKGQTVHKTYFQITRNQLQMMITKNGKFNQTQRLLLIQYKRLYQNRVIWMWFIRFRLYEQVYRIKIHKWKCIDLHNSYMLFTMIIQNKKQRKNYKRRQAIMRHQYVDPFNYNKAREFMELEFTRLRGKKQRQNIQILNNKKFGNAASTFTYTNSYQQAAGTLINFDEGQHCQIYFRQLQKGDGVRLQQKLRMLLLGQYKGVKLFRGWKMSRKKTNALRKKYPQIFQTYGYMF